MRRSLALWSQLLAAAAAIPWFGPAQTATIERVPQAPIVTDAPVLPRWFSGLSKRDLAPGICGWVEGFTQNPYSCTGTSTCLWNTDYHVIACGVPSSVAFQTQCVGFFDQSADCDVSCSFNPSINRCPATIPYCVNITLGGADVPYTAFACGTSSYSSYPEVQLTYIGETTLNLLPRYLEADGQISLGTQTPSGYTGPSASSSAAPSSTSSSLTSQTSSSQTSSESNTIHTQTPAPQIPSSSPTPSPSTGSSSNTGAIAGGVVGGVAGIAIIAGLIVFFIIRSRRKQREAGLAQNAQLAGQTETKNQVPGGPQSYPGSPAPAYPQPQGMYGQPGYVAPQQGYPQQGYYPQQQPGLNELSGTAAPSEMQVPHQQFPHQSFHELQ